MNLVETLHLTQRLVAFALVLQTVEFFLLQRRIGSVWQWEIVRLDFQCFPAFLRRMFDVTLAYPQFLGLLAAQLILACGLLALPQGVLRPSLLGGLLITTFFVNLRFRGTFNGGSDQMTILILLSLVVAAIFPALRGAAAWYVCIQTCLSFLLSGIVKLRSSGWRTGVTLTALLRTALVEVPPGIVQLMRRPNWALFASWAVIVFEVAFPLILLSKRAAVGYIAAAMVFHVINFQVFGLNRFVFAWAAAYPSVYYCSSRG